MKKIIVLLFLCIFLSGCQASNSVYYDVYIASIGFEHTEDGYKGYFFLPSSVDVGNTKGDESDSQSEVAKVEGNSISDVFSNLENSSMLRSNLMHISSIVLDQSMLNSYDIDSLIGYVKESAKIDFNFYIFVTKDKLEDIYKVSNPNKENVILTLLIEPVVGNYICMSAEPIHFLNFCRDYYEKKVIKLPLLSVESVWKENDSIYSKGVVFLSDKAYIFDNNEDFEYMKNNEYIEYSDDSINCGLKKYKVNIKYNEIIEIKVKYELEIFSVSNQNINENYMNLKIEEKIKKLIESYQSEVDFLNLRYRDSMDKEIKIIVKDKEKD